MTAETLKQANELKKEIERLESFMFWCSGKREGHRIYPASVIKLKRRWLGGVESDEYELSKRLQERISQCIEEELELLKKDLENL